MDKYSQLIDQTLTPENAESRGYEWVYDETYDVSAPDEVNDPLIELTQKGFKIGQAAARYPDNFVGVYEVIKQDS